MSKLILAAATAGLLALGAASAGNASAITGTVYLNQASQSVTASPTGGGDATFTTNAINYNPSDSSSVYTLGAFLNNPTFTDTSSTFTAAGGSNASLGYGTGNTQIDLTGMLHLNAGANTFVVGHDDGVVLNIPDAGYTLNDGGPTSFSNSSFTVNNPGKAGNYAFTLDYVESSGPPAALVFSVNNYVVGVPEPTSWALMLLGVGGIGAALRGSRRRSAVTA